MPSPPPIHLHPLPYVACLGMRERDQIHRVVIHCTELPDLAMAREYGERVLYADGSGNSGHYYIDRDGRIEQYVPLERVAHHVRGQNSDSIGIELVNRGRYPHWLDSRHQAMVDPYPEAQLQALEGLLRWLRGELPALAGLIGHDALDTTVEAASDDPALRVQRKLDPGPMFPWPRIRASFAGAAPAAHHVDT